MSDISWLFEPSKEDLKARIAEFERILDGLPQDAIDGGWTARGISAHAKKLEARIAELESAQSRQQGAVAWRVKKSWEPTIAWHVTDKLPDEHERDDYVIVPLYTHPAHSQSPDSDRKDAEPDWLFWHESSTEVFGPVVDNVREVLAGFPGGDRWATEVRKLVDAHNAALSKQPKRGE